MGDAKITSEAIARGLGEDLIPRVETESEVARLRREIRTNLSTSEQRHCRTLDVLRAALPADTVVMGDVCQLVYTGPFGFDVSRPKLWHFPASYCTLGCGLPGAIGAKLALPKSPVATLVGDGGCMFTVQELVTAAELRLPIPIILWNNEGLKEIEDGMTERGIDLVGVSGSNPDFLALARACGCHALAIDGAESLTAAVKDALAADRPTLIEVREYDACLE